MTKYGSRYETGVSEYIWSPALHYGAQLKRIRSEQSSLSLTLPLSLTLSL
jgi:hypothetical protein